MNLDNNPTIEQLRELVRQCDDWAGHHVLWVNKTGDVDIACIPGEQAPAQFEESHADVQMRFETFLVGNEYVGPAAAADDDWIVELFERLKNEWHAAKGKPGVVSIDGL